MTALPTEDMSKILPTAASQSAILNHFPWLPNGKKLVNCTVRSEPLLRKAGVLQPIPLEDYEVSVRRDEAGFLVLNPYAPAQLTARRVLTAHRVVAADRAARADLAPELDALSELARTRTFELMFDSHSKVRIQVMAYEDVSLPSPNELEDWRPRKPCDAQVIAAVAAMHHGRLAEIESL